MSDLLRSSKPVVDEPARVRPVQPDIATPEHRPWARRHFVLVAGLLYLALSLVVFWHVWTAHPTNTTLCGCDDQSLFTWFIAWPAHAILHGQNPFHSTALFYPGGTNLLSNTSELAIGVLLAPVTWLFGPIATLNVALVLTPVASALAMCILLRRWVSWLPAAFIGGLAYGFAPFLLLNLTNSWFMVSLGVVPPLIVLCFDELLFRQNRRPVRVGIGLGLLVAVQFFIGTELLLIMAVCAAIGLALVVAYAALRRPDTLRARAHHAAVGLGAGALSASLLLAYPLWFTLSGPSHLSGAIWPSFPLYEAGISLRRIFLPTPAQVFGFGGYDWNHLYGGYRGPILSPQYFGIGIVVVLIAGFLAFRRDRKMWLFGIMALVSFALSVGTTKGAFLPWQLLVHLPQFENILPPRFLDVTWLCVGILVALIVDHTFAAVDEWQRSRDRTPVSDGGTPGRTRRWLAPSAALLVAAVALVQPATYVAQTVPFTTESVVLPTWFRTVAPHLDERQVLLIVPFPSSIRVSAATWQAVDAMTFSMVGGPGPAEVPSREGAERPGASVISDLSVHASIPSAAAVGAVRDSLREWGVTMVVVPDQPGLPLYDRIPSVTLAAALMTAAVGEKPVHQDGAWVWSGVGHLVASPHTAPSDVAACVHGLSNRGTAAVEAATSCVLGNQA
jgi:hypothetical protein